MSNCTLTNQLVGAASFVKLTLNGLEEEKEPMSGGIYLVGDNDELVEMSETSYASEDILQELLAKYPNLLAGDQIDSEEPRRWLLVTREMGLPSDDLSGNRWAVDHLFLDQDGIPTLVEVKRGENTQIRREVVGQLLEYAANAVSYWPVDRITAELDRRCEQENIDSLWLIVYENEELLTVGRNVAQVLPDDLEIKSQRQIPPYKVYEFVLDVGP